MAKQVQWRNLVYVHSIGDRGIFYVGKGTINRAKETNPNRRNEHYNNIVKKYSNDIIKFGFIECSSENNAFLLEIGIIKCLKKMGIKLSNKTDGGEGASGYKMTYEEKLKLSERMKGSRLSKETKYKISTALIGNKNAFGRIFKHSDKSKELLSISQLERFKKNPVSCESKLKMSKSKTGKKFDLSICPYCGKEGRLSGLKSWHFDYCKDNPNKLLRRR